MTGGELSEAQQGVRALWRECADKGLTEGINYPKIVRTLFEDIDDAEQRAGAAEAEVARLTAERDHWKRAADGSSTALAEKVTRVMVERNHLAALVEAGLALADEWDDFEHDMSACQKYDCGDCTMKNAVHDLRAALGGTA